MHGEHDSNANMLFAFMFATRMENSFHHHHNEVGFAFQYVEIDKVPDKYWNRCKRAAFSLKLLTYVKVRKYYTDDRFVPLRDSATSNTDKIL